MEISNFDLQPHLHLKDDSDIVGVDVDVATSWLCQAEYKSVRFDVQEYSWRAYPELDDGIACQYLILTVVIPRNALV